MTILDTTLWVVGTLRTNEQAAALLAEIDRGETTSAINAYMIQAKDVPIPVLAFEHRDREPTILTNNESFAEFEPTAHLLPEISIEHVP